MQQQPTWQDGARRDRGPGYEFGRRRSRNAVAALTAAALLAVVGCSGDSSSTAAKTAAQKNAAAGLPLGVHPAGDAIGDSSGTGAFVAQGGVGFADVTDATPGADVALLDKGGKQLQRTVVDRLGSAMFYNVEPGDGYEIRVKADDKVEASKPFKVLNLDDHPDQSFYDKATPLVEGFQYITARDGTKLAVTVRPPLGLKMADGPYPTVINMSGYADADPYGTGPPMSQVAGALGFATVSVNERGSGCSGGVNQLFDKTWAADGYDVIETVAAQKWSKKIGLVGISFPGITQFYTAATHPPHLAAINPLSVLSDIYRSPGYIGGIFNNGFSESWLTDRQNDAKVSPEGGQGYAAQRITEDNDTVCKDNQKLRAQTLDIMGIINEHPYRSDAIHGDRSPINHVGDITVPMLVMNAWQDEQVGSDSVNLLDAFPDRPDAKMTVVNGTHSSTLDPINLAKLIAFLDIYVAERVPDFSKLGLIGPVLYQETLSHPDVFPEPYNENPYKDMKTVEEAKKYFESQPRLQVTFDSGGDPAQPGIPNVGYTAGFDSYPPKESTVTRMFFGDKGALATAKPEGSDLFDRYFPTSVSRPMQTLPGQGQAESWAVLPEYDWRPLVDNTAVGYLSDPFDKDTTIVGSASADLWLRLNSEDTDLQVTMTEVRPDNTEVYVQSGWLRASHRKLDTKRSTDTRPWPTHTKEDAAPMPAGKFELVRVATDPVGFTFRKGSRLRVTVAAVGGDRTRWSFETPFSDPDRTVDVGRSGDHASSIALPFLTSIDAPDQLPACPGLRGEPCRKYEKATNGG